MAIYAAVAIVIANLFVGVTLAQAAPSLAGCPVLPVNNVWNTPVDHLPVDSNSSAYIATIGPDTGVHPDFGSAFWEGGPIGIPYNLVPGDQPRVSVSFEYADESDPGPYPIPPNAVIEGGSSSTGDRHVLVVDQQNCLLYETFSSYPQLDGSWKTGSGAVFDLRSNSLRPSGWTSADAAGLLILPGLVRYDEVAAGEIRHALRFTAPRTQKKFVWPARHYASSLTGANYPPMGKRFRLRANFDVATFSPEIQIILRALKKYGMILADNGSAWYISGTPDPHWNDDVIVSELRRVKGSDFEAVDESRLMIFADSGQARQSASIDLNADGRPDLLWQHATSGDVYLWAMDGLTHTGGTYLAQGMNPWQVVGTADVTGDGRPDLLWQHATSGDVYLWTMNGTTQAGGTYLARNMGPWKLVATGDFCGSDGNPDLLWQHDTTGDAYVWCMNGTTMTNGMYLAQSMGLWKIAAAADLNGDGHPDLLWQHTTSGDVYVWFMTGTTHTGGTYLASGLGTWKVVAAADLNADGSPDLLWQDASTGDVYVWYLKGASVTNGAYVAQGKGPWRVVGPK
jgi:hypothetical protein